MRKARARARKAFVACLNVCLHSAQGRPRDLLEEALLRALLHGLATWTFVGRGHPGSTNKLGAATRVLRISLERQPGFYE